MPASPSRQLPLILSLAVALAIVAALFLRDETTEKIPAPAPLTESPGKPGAHPNGPTPNTGEASATPAPPTGLSALADAPDWTRLNEFQNTISRKAFEHLLTKVFTTGDAWRGHIRIEDDQAVIHTGLPEPDDLFHLRFAPAGLASPTPRLWRPATGLPPAPADRPLDGLHIAIDPGHIGGEWARMEERWFVVGDGIPVMEGNMTLHVAKLLQPKLEALGAKISLVRDKNEPLTPLRPESLMPEPDKEAGESPESPAAMRKLAERLFYRTAEIRARAHLVNETLKPDLVLCLHFNAEAWGDPDAPTLIDRTHLHLLLNGAYNDDEIMLADQRHAMLLKLLQRTHEEEALVGATVADVFAEASGLPPYRYPPGSKNALPVNGHPYLWARNLLANRLYDCPVIFMEPYVMNSVLDHARIQAGDYEGLREVEGEMRPSIFREYADALTEGLALHYRRKRALQK